jgi:hypothetical protein
MLLLSSLPDCGTEPLGTGFGGTHSRVGPLFGFILVQASKSSFAFAFDDDVLGFALDAYCAYRCAPAEAVGAALGRVGGGFGGGAH